MRRVAVIVLPAVGALVGCSGGSSGPTPLTVGSRGAVVLPGEYTAWVLPPSSPTPAETRAVRDCAALMPSATKPRLIEGALAFGFSGAKSERKTEQLANEADDCLDRAVPAAKSFGVVHVCHSKGSASAVQPSHQPGVPEAFQPRC